MTVWPLLEAHIDLHNIWLLPPQPSMRIYSHVLDHAQSPVLQLRFIFDFTATEHYRFSLPLCLSDLEIGDVRTSYEGAQSCNGIGI